MSWLVDLARSVALLCCLTFAACFADKGHSDAELAPEDLADLLAPIAAAIDGGFSIEDAGGVQAQVSAEPDTREYDFCYRDVVYKGKKFSGFRMVLGRTPAGTVIVTFYPLGEASLPLVEALVERIPERFR